MNHPLVAFLLIALAPWSAFGSTDEAPSALFRACQHLLDPPDARVWMVKKDGRSVVLLTVRPAASVRHLPEWVRDVVTTARYFTSPETATSTVGKADEVPERRTRARADVGVREGLGPATYGRLENIFEEIGLPREELPRLTVIEVSIILMTRVVSSIVKESGVRAEFQSARALALRASTPALEPTDIARLVTEIDMNKNLVALAREAGVETLDLIGEFSSEDFRAQYGSVDFLESLIESFELLKKQNLRFDPFDDENPVRLDDNIDRFALLVPAARADMDSGTLNCVRAVRRAAADYPGTVVQSEPQLLAGSSGVLHRLRAEGWTVERVPGPQKWDKVRTQFRKTVRRRGNPE